jgi:hypothetical protein
MNTNKPSKKTTKTDKIKTERDALVGLVQSLLWARGGRSSTNELVQEGIRYLEIIGEGHGI